MAFTAIIRRSASTLAPLAIRTTSAPRHHHSAVFTALNHLNFSRKPSSPVPNDVVFFRSGHGFATSPAMKRPSSDEVLLSVLESEIQVALEDDHGPEKHYNCINFAPKAGLVGVIKLADAVELSGLEEFQKNFPFDIEDNPGEQTIFLKRGYQGESIEVMVHMPDIISGFEEEGEDDNGDDAADEDDVSEKGAQSTIPLTVRISKKNHPTLEFDVTAYAEEIEIDSMLIKNPETSEDTIPYEGPDFSDLDENIQKAFIKYLEIRGIKSSTTAFLHEYMIGKDGREYCNWLKNLKEFVEA